MADYEADEPRRRPLQPIPSHTKLVWGFVTIVVSFGLYVVMFPVSTGRGRQNDLSDMRQISVSLIMYSSDNDDHYPRSAHWMDAIRPYSKSEVILHSLALLPLHSATPPTPSDPYGIAFLKSLDSLNSAKIRTPERVAVVFDSTDLSRNAAGELNLLPNPPRYMNGTGSFNYIGFVDGHVKGLPMPLVGVK